MNEILNLIYPPKCIVCGMLTETDCICPDCNEELVLCGSETKGHALGSFDQCISIYEYACVKDLIHRFKYNHKIWMGRVMGKIMANYLMDNHSRILAETDIIAAVPISGKKEKLRGFNQADILAQEIGLVTGIKFIKNVIMRNRETAPQSLVDYSQRLSNVDGAFKTCGCVKNLNILLIDDIYTTGSTLASVSNELKAAKCGHVNCATFSNHQIEFLYNFIHKSCKVLKYR